MNMKLGSFCVSRIVQWGIEYINLSFPRESIWKGIDKGIEVRLDQEREQT
jgi:hypothetical protein